MLNTIKVTAAPGTFAGNYPIRIGRPFAQGEIKGAPLAVVNGAALATQADVRTRWPDGSVKHAALSFILPQANASVAFVNQAAANTETASHMLDDAFDFDAVLDLGPLGKASARTMLAVGNYTVRSAGAVATTIILADHSAAKRYDLGNIRPIFHATFWHDLKKVQVRIIAENANSEALKDVTYNAKIILGRKNPTVMFTAGNVTHYAETRWTKTFWIGGDPGPVNIDHNIAYLSSTFAFPNFDPSIKIAEKDIAATYKKYINADRGLYGDGGWQNEMNATGGRPDIGPYTAQVAQWLLSGDHRLFEVVSDMADLAGAWPLQVRECDPAKASFGHPISVYDRPSLWLNDDRGNAKPEDDIAIAGPRILNQKEQLWGGWKEQVSHQPDPYSALYCLTDDFFALEQLQLWASASALRTAPANRGPTGGGGHGGYHGEVRADAWLLRTRTHAADLSPDGSPEKAYFAKLMADLIADWEGMHGITGTPNENTAAWTYAKKRFASVVSPHLHVWAVNERTQDEDRGGLLANTFSAAGAMWETYFVIFELGRAKEKGFATGPLLSHAGLMLTGQFAEPSYDPHNIQRYHTAFRDPHKVWFPNWTATLVCYADPVDMTFAGGVGDGYASYAYGASTMLVNEPGGKKAYDWLRANFFEPNRSKYSGSPKWAYVAR